MATSDLKPQGTPGREFYDEQIALLQLSWFRFRKS